MQDSLVPLVRSKKAILHKPPCLVFLPVWLSVARVPFLLRILFIIALLLSQAPPPPDARQGLHAPSATSRPFPARMPLPSAPVMYLHPSSWTMATFLYPSPFPLLPSLPLSLPVHVASFACQALASPRPATAVHLAPRASARPPPTVPHAGPPPTLQRQAAPPQTRALAPALAARRAPSRPPLAHLFVAFALPALSVREATPAARHAPRGPPPFLGLPLASQRQLATPSPHPMAWFPSNAFSL